MKIHRIHILALAFGLLAPSYGRCQTDVHNEYSVTEYKRMYSILYRLLQLDGSATSSGTLLSLVSGGRPVGKIDMTKFEGRLNASDLANTAPEISWVYSPSAGQKVFDVYKDVITTRDLPSPKTLNAEQQQIKRETTASLYEPVTSEDEELVPKAKLKQYFAQTSAIEALKQAWVAQPDAAQRQVIQLRLNAAEAALADSDLQTWAEDRLERLATINALTLGTYWRGLKGRFTTFAGLENHSAFPTTYLFPEPADWADDTLWSHLKVNADSWSSSYERKEFKLSAGGSVSLGFLSVGGSGGTSSLSEKEASEFKDLTIEMDLLRVSISRPWMDNGVFFSPFNWRFSPGSGKAAIAAATSVEGLPRLVDDQNKQCRLPVMPVELLLVKKVTISAKWTTAQRAFLTSHSGGGGGFSFGPYSFGGSGGSTTTTSSSSGTADQVSYTATGIQMIGVVSKVLPKCPDPSADIHWISGD